MREPRIGDQVLYMQSKQDGYDVYPAFITQVSGKQVQIAVLNGGLGQVVFCRAEHGISDGNWFYSGEYGI